MGIMRVKSVGGYELTLSNSPYTVRVRRYGSPNRRTPEYDETYVCDTEDEANASWNRVQDEILGVGLPPAAEVAEELSKTLGLSGVADVISPPEEPEHRHFYRVSGRCRCGAEGEPGARG